SNSERGMLDAKLAALGITDLVDASIAIEDVAEPKPAPDMYVAAARALGAKPADCLGFEDSETGADAARAAGLQLIVVPSLPGQEPRAPRRLASLADPVLTDWIAGWEVRRWAPRPRPASPRPSATGPRARWSSTATACCWTPNRCGSAPRTASSPSTAPCCRRATSTCCTARRSRSRQS